MVNRTQIVTVAVVGLAMTGSVFLYRSNQPAAPVFAPPAQVTDTMPTDSRGSTEAGRMMPPGTSKQAVVQKPEKFSGKLESVNTGCYSDGECFVMVDSKHVSAILEWPREDVGTVRGVSNFGDLEKHIGETVSVYANKLDDDSYTLYGSTEYFISLAK